MNKPLSIEVCICTFRRKHLFDTLCSLSALDIDRAWHVRVLVVDNDDTPSAEDIFNSALALSLPFPCRYLHVAGRNISVARNACLSNSRADFLAFIDDDELADPAWLRNLVATALSQDAVAVLGPVNALYSNDMPRWIRCGDFHSTRPVRVNGSIETGYTCNLLLDRRNEAVRLLSFKPELGRSGGEDTVFLFELYQAGYRISYSPDALVTEPVAPERANLFWLVRRRFRSGQTYALLLSLKNREGGHGRFRHLVKSSSKMLFCYGMALVSIWSIERSVYWILRGALHSGVAARLLGVTEGVQYGR